MAVTMGRSRSRMGLALALAAASVPLTGGRAEAAAGSDIRTHEMTFTDPAGAQVECSVLVHSEIEGGGPGTPGRGLSRTVMSGDARCLDAWLVIFVRYTDAVGTEHSYFTAGGGEEVRIGFNDVDTTEPYIATHQVQFFDGCRSGCTFETVTRPK